MELSENEMRNSYHDRNPGLRSVAALAAVLRTGRRINCMSCRGRCNGSSWHHGSFAARSYCVRHRVKYHGPSHAELSELDVSVVRYGSFSFVLIVEI